MQGGIGKDNSLIADQSVPAEPVAEWRGKGIGGWGITARGGAIAPAPEARSAPDGFRPADPDDPQYNWGFLDREIALVRGAGMKVVLTVTGWGPLWGSQFPVKRNPRYKPVPKRFAAFATAVAKRYGASVDRYIVWNEPNQAPWLTPQSECTSSGRCSPY